MKIVFVSDVEHGGAAIACRRLAGALHSTGLSVTWVTGDGCCSAAGGERDVLPIDLSGEVLSRLARRLGLSRAGLDLLERRKLENRLLRSIGLLRPDVIHIHNIHHNLTFRLAEELPSEIPVVWTLHDMWPLTGYCCHSMECQKFTTGCHGECPQAGKWGAGHDTHGNEWKRRETFFRRNAHRVHLVCPSEWMLRQVRTRFGENVSATVIRNCLDLNVFRPVRPKAAVRQSLGLPADARVVLSSAHWVDDPLKGAGLLNSAVELVRSERHIDLVQLAVGERTVRGEAPSQVRYTGPIRDESFMNLYYNAADLMVLPTSADNLPNTIAESLSAGTACVASNIGGCPEMVADGQTGFLVVPNNAEALADGLCKYFELDSASTSRMSDTCRARAVSMFAPEAVARDFSAVYGRRARNM